MSRDHSKPRRNDHHSLKNLPSEVLLKARSTLVSLGGALKHKHDHHEKGKTSKHEKDKEKKQQERLKSSQSEPEFSEMRKKHRSRMEENSTRDYGATTRQRPMSVGGSKHYDKELGNFRCGSFPRDMPPMQRHADSTEEVFLQSRLYIPVAERLSDQDIQMQDVNERPRKKLSFREPEIIISSDCGLVTSTLGRSNKHMGVNSLSRRSNRISLRNEAFSSSIECLESDLESQAMRIVRTVGQAFEVCHKMQVNSPGEPAPSASSVVEEPAPSCSDVAASKEVASECGASETASAPAPVVEEAAPGRKEEPVRPTHLELLPPPPRKESKRTRTIPTPIINLPDLPECISKVEVSTDAAPDASTPLSAQHQLQLLRERLDQQAQQTRAAVAQLLLLRDQLAAEQAARCEAQARTHQLLVHNKELLEHIAALVAHLQDRERGTPCPINAQQLTLLPQTPEKFATCNGNLARSEELIDLFSPNNNSKYIENNNGTHLPFSVSPSPSEGASCFGDMSNEQIQDYLITKFEEMGGFPNNKPAKSTFNANQQYFQNCQAFPNIPPLVSHYSNADLQSLLNHSSFNEPSSSGNMAQSMNVAESDNSLFSPDTPESPDSSSKDSSDSSSDEGIPFIKPLSHNGTLTATGEDGRVRLIVPVSPSESVSDVGARGGLIEGTTQAAGGSGGSGNTLKVPGSVAPNAPITRTTSEKVPNRSEMMTAMRQQWTRHTTK